MNRYYWSQHQLDEWASNCLAQYLSPRSVPGLFQALRHAKLNEIDLSVLRLMIPGKWRPVRSNQSQRLSQSNCITCRELAAAIRCTASAVHVAIRKINMLCGKRLFLFGPLGITANPTLFDIHMCKVFSEKLGPALHRAHVENIERAEEKRVAFDPAEVTQQQVSA